ncbi:MAG: hypothetical protein CL917_10245 [Deltaproteobacteria bacterium]|nr:hypothetical protein [Deltaproteobacteria bacterium]
MSGKNVVVVGSSAAGLFSTLALSQSGHQVTVLEKEDLTPCDSPVEAFESWERRGAPQTRHSHAFLARLHNGIKEKLPVLYDELMAAGAETLNFRKMVEETQSAPEFIPEDDELVLLACRRITLDWVLQKHVDQHTDAVRRTGVEVLGLISEMDEEAGLPRVTGVQIKTGDGKTEDLHADLVIDASGRNSHLKHWLEAIDSEPMEQETESCGIFYCSRFYRVREGATPPPIEGPIAGDLGYLKYAIFQGDSGVFSITLAASPTDDSLRKMRHEEVFQTIAKHLPATREWMKDEISEPITDVYTYANLKNTRRFFVKDGQPRALGLFPIGDSLIHMNPIAGRGCTLSWVSAWLMAEALDAHPGDPLAFARELDEGLIREIVPWYENMRVQDRGAQEMAQMEESGEDAYEFQRPDGSVDPKAYMRSLLRDGVMPAMQEDIVVMRALMRVFNMLEAPNDILAQPDLLPRILAVWQRRGERKSVRMGPSRRELIGEIESAAA